MLISISAEQGARLLEANKKLEAAKKRYYRVLFAIIPQSYFKEYGAITLQWADKVWQPNDA